MRHKLDLSEMVVSRHRMEEAFPNVFFIKAKEKSYIFEDENIDEWLKQINNAIDEQQKKQEQFPLKTDRPISAQKQKELNHRLGFTAPIMIPDNHVALCQVSTYLLRF